MVAGALVAVIASSVGANDEPNEIQPKLPHVNQ